MRMRHVLLAGFLAAGIAATASAAQATNGTLTFQNATGSTISTNVDFDCDAFDNTTCPIHPYPITPGTSVTLTVPSSVPSSTKYGLVGGYFTYTALTKSVLGGPAWCKFQVKVQSNYYKRWSGQVYSYKAIDGFIPYTPSCTVTSFTINSTTGVWAATVRMQ